MLADIAERFQQLFSFDLDNLMLPHRIAHETSLEQRRPMAPHYIPSNVTCSPDMAVSTADCVSEIR